MIQELFFGAAGFSLSFLSRAPTVSMNIATCAGQKIWGACWPISQFFNHDGYKHSIFWFCALAGSGLFVIQLLLTLFGAFDFEDGGEASSSEAGQFKWLSKQAITGFLMLFGWAGLTCLEQFDFSMGSAVLVASASGLVAMAVSGFIFKMARKLHSPGTVFNIDDAVGRNAIVYHRIPKDGRGKISLSLHNFTHEIDAVSLTGEEIASFSAVQVVKKADERTVVVVPIK